MKKYLLLLILALTAGITPVKLHALTADDLVGKIICQGVKGCIIEQSVIISQNGTAYFTKNSDTQVVLHNFFEAGWELTFDIVGNTLRCTINNDDITNVATNVKANFIKLKSGFKAPFWVNAWEGGISSAEYYCYKLVDGKWTGTYTPKNTQTGEYAKIEFEPFRLYPENMSRAWYSEGATLFILPPNCVQQATVANADNMQIQYNLSAALLPSRNAYATFQMANFINRGIVWDQTIPATYGSAVPSSIYGNVYGTPDVVNKIDGTLTIPRCKANDFANRSYGTVEGAIIYTSTYNWNNDIGGELGDVIDDDDSGNYTQVCWYWGAKAGTAPTSYSQLGDITGTIHLHDPSVEGNQWDVAVGGTYKRKVQADVHLNDFYQFAGSSNYLLIHDWHTTIPNIDLTPTVTNSLDRYGYGEKQGIYMGGKLTLGVNRQYFDHAELWLVPGRISSVSGRTDLDSDTGLAGAINITEDYSWFRWNETGLDTIPSTFGDGHGSNPDWASQWPKKDRDWMAARLMAAPNDNGEIFYNHLVSPTELGWEAPADNAPAKRRVAAHNDYTVFAKVYYTEESGLQPTFHGLASSLQVTGIDDITVTPAAEATELGHCDLQGRRIDATTPGVHIIRMSDGTARKSVVK